MKVWGTGTTSEAIAFSVAADKTATFGGDIMPAAENAHNIGSASVRWEDLYVDDGYIRNAYIDDYIYHNGDADTYIYFQTDSIKLRAGGTDWVTHNSSGSTFAGDVTLAASKKLYLDGGTHTYLE